jgi:hypothetical protein
MSGRSDYREPAPWGGLVGRLPSNSPSHLRILEATLRAMCMRDLPIRIRHPRRGGQWRVTAEGKLEHTMVAARHARFVTGSRLIGRRPRHQPRVGKRGPRRGAPAARTWPSHPERHTYSARIDAFVHRWRWGAPPPEVEPLATWDVQDNHPCSTRARLPLTGSRSSSWTAVCSYLGRLRRRARSR